jgi:purine-binding chemotaxis protein CheW
MVDAVSDILTVTDDVIQPTPDLASEATKTLVRGLIAIDGRMISLVVLDGLLSVRQLEAA